MLRYTADDATVSLLRKKCYCLFSIGNDTDADRPKSGVHEFGLFGQKVEFLSFPTSVSDRKLDHY